MILERIASPADVKQLSREELENKPEQKSRVELGNRVELGRRKEPAGNIASGLWEL